MAIKKTDRDAVIDAALRLFRVQGYHHTSVADISSACGLLKGSIYHYFPGKRELALAALDRVIDDARESLFAVAADDRIPAETRIKMLAEAVEHYFIGREGGCLMGNLALELGGAEPEFTQRIKTYFDEWATALTHVLKARYGEASARQMARDAIARVQGAIMLMGLFNDQSVLQRASRDTVALLVSGSAASNERVTV